MYTYLKIRMFLDTDEYDNIHHHLRNILLSKNAQAIMKKRTKMIVYDTVFNNNDREKELIDNVDYILDYQNKAFHEHEKKYGNTKRFFMNFRLDTANDECLSMLEKLIFENVKRCMKELDNEFDEKVHTIEYWLNNKYYSIHVDCDSELYQNTNGEILRQGIHNGIIYMDDNYEPTFISEFTREDRDLNTVQRMDSAFVLSFPKNSGALRLMVEIIMEQFHMINIKKKKGLLLHITYGSKRVVQILMKVYFQLIIQTLSKKMILH